MRPHSPPTVSTEPTDIFRRELNGGGGGGGRAKIVLNNANAISYEEIYTQNNIHI